MYRKTLASRMYITSFFRIVTTVFLALLFCVFFASEVFAVSVYYIGPNAYDISDATPAGVSQNYTINQLSDVEGIAFNFDGNKLFIVGGTQDVLEYDVSTPFDVSTASYAGVSESLDVSGQVTKAIDLTFNRDGEYLYVVDETGQVIVEYNMSAPFDISTATPTGDTLDVSTEETSPQDAVFSRDGMKLFVSGNTDSSIVEYALTTAYDLTTASHTGASEELDVSAQESEPQGFTFNNDGTKLFMGGTDTLNVHEYTLSTAFDVSTATHAGTSEQYSLFGYSNEIHDIVFHHDGSKFFIASNGTGPYLAEFNIDPGDYVENIANDGTINNSSPLVIEIWGTQFLDSDNDDLFDHLSEYRIYSVPDGITPSLVLSDSDQRATLTLSGNAIFHDDVNDVGALRFRFYDSAFSGFVASSVNWSGDAVPHGSGVGIDFLADPVSSSSTSSGTTRRRLPLGLFNGLMRGYTGTMPIVDQPPYCPYFTQDLIYGDRDGRESINEVSKLQNFLGVLNYFTVVDGIFGSDTKRQVTGWQNQYAQHVLGPWGLVTGTGHFLQSSRWWANKQVGCHTTVILKNGVVLQ